MLWSSTFSSGYCKYEYLEGIVKLWLSASYISKSDTDLVTIGSSAYRVYRYEGKLNLLENATLLLAMDRYQVRSIQAIDRYLALLMFTTLCCKYDSHGSLIDGLHRYRLQKKHDMIEYIYNQARSGATLDLKCSSEWHRDAVSSLYLQIFEVIIGKCSYNLITRCRLTQ